MFDFGIGTSELLVIVVVALIVVGPKELPALLRTIGRMVGKVKALAAEFQGHLDELARETGVDDVKKKVEEEMEELSIEDLDREFTEIEREMREQLASGAKPLSEAEEADDEDLTGEDERPLPETLDLDEDLDETGEDDEEDMPEPPAPEPSAEEKVALQTTRPEPPTSRDAPEAERPKEPKEKAASSRTEKTPSSKAVVGE